ncbi:MAG: CehA/McbA family metallohydrolase [bacterium]
MILRFKKMTAVVFLAALLLSACSGSKGEPSPNISGYPETPFTIHSESELIGGPNAQGRVGDVLLKNDKIRVIIQKPTKNSNVDSFGGNIIDADLVRGSGAPGQDSMGSIFPLVNVEWTVNYQNYEAVTEGTASGAQVLRAHGLIDVYDYLDLDFIGEVAQGIAGQSITFSNRFDDRRNPFEIYDDLKGLSQEVTTDYTLEPGTNYVRIDTTFKNDGEKDVMLPMGQFVCVSGQVSMLIPGIGFTPDLMTQVGGNTPALVYSAFDGTDVSYGVFFNAAQFMDPKTGAPLNSASISYSGVSGLVFGEEFLKLLPLGLGGTPEIHFTIPAGQSRTITSYFVVGNGSSGSVMDAGLAAIGAATRPVSGKVQDAAGQPVAGATVAVSSTGGTLITYRTDSTGRFSGQLPTGGDLESKRFGNGRYKVSVEMQGYQKNGTTDAGACEPTELDVATKDAATVVCTLGEAGKISLSKPVMDADTGQPIPARLTIVGEDPSPNKVGSAGRFRSTYHWDQPFGIVDLKYITAKGTFDLTGSASFNMEPGTYLLAVSHGVEYTDDERVVEVAAGGTVDLGEIKLKRVVRTPGYISADLHIHSIVSPDSNLTQEMRVLSAAAEGLDVLQSSDHDYITDYSAVISSLASQGIIRGGSMRSSPGDEVTPNHYGHIHAFPLTPDPADPDGGAPDWSELPDDKVSMSPELGPTLDELITTLRSDPANPVIQINHLMDNPTGLPLASGWVTTPFYMDNFGVAPLSSYADPVERRMPPRTSGTEFPIPFGNTGLMTVNYDAVELVVGPHLHDNGILFRSAIPTWFNLLNLGLLATATADSDSHRAMPDPVGIPRNYIASSVDPADGAGSSNDAIDLNEYAASIKAHKVTISAGPVITVKAKNDSGATADVGGTIAGKHAQFTVEVTAASWAWFDTIEVYANTEPMPVDDATDTPMEGTAADPAQFYKPYHMPRYSYQPTKTFSVAEGSLTGWKQENGVITASVTFDLNVDEDTWVVVMARGTRATSGFRSLFPIVTRALVDEAKAPDTIDPTNLTAFHTDERVGASAWALANPIFIDMDGDGFTAKYVKQGISPITK